MNVLITGGAGFIGSHAVVALIESGFDVFIVDNFSNSYPQSLLGIEKITGKHVQYFQCNVEDTFKLEKVFVKNRIDAVMHFANLKSNAESIIKPEKYYASNIGSMFSLLCLCEKYGVSRFIFSSSATVYGSPDKMPVTEDYPIGKVLSPYGLGKYLCELYLRDYAASHSGFRAISLRYFNPIGAHPSGLIGECSRDKTPTSLVPYITDVLLGKLPYLNVFGNDYDTADGTGLRDYVHVMDVAYGHVSAMRYLETMRIGHDVFNLGTGKGTTVLELVRAFEAVSEKTIPFKFAPRRPGDVSRSFADVTKAKALMGWSATRTILDCAEDTWRWKNMNPNGFSDQ